MKRPGPPSFRILPPVLLALAALGGLCALWVRDAWFDEAMTLLMYAPLDYGAIMLEYGQPNNHIGYTLFLKWWDSLNFGMAPDLFGRAGSMALALTALLILYFRHFREAGGRVAWALLLGVFAVSLPFALYGTALRGYMASFLAVVLALETGRAVLRSGGIPAWLGYAASCYLAVLILPSNLLALGGAVLWLAPSAGKAWWRRPRLWALALLPCLALAAACLPVAGQMLKALKAGESWSNPWLAGVALYLGFLLALAPAIVFTACGWKRFPGKIRLAALLLPIVPLIVLPSAPFPRNFFPLWPVWLLLLGSAWRIVNLKMRRRRLLLWGLLAVCGLGWAWGQRALAPCLSEAVGGSRFDDRGQDDWFAPYYLRDGFAIRPTAEYLERNYAGKPVFVSFDADYFPLTFYSDRPRYLPWFAAVDRLPAGAAIVLAADEGDAGVDRVMERFGLSRRPIRIHANDFHHIYSTR